MLTPGPTPQTKPYHLAKWVSAAGGVSALCFSAPRAIDLTLAGWTVSPEHVTCPRCKAKMGARS